MTKNWYAVYTKPNRQKRVSTILTKKRIENYCPVNYTVALKSTGKKPGTIPLFNYFIFVCIGENEIQYLKSISDVVNFMFWKSKPAVIKDEEIRMVKKLSQSCINIKLEKINVGINDIISITNGLQTNFNEPIRTSTKHLLKITLPTLGYAMFVEKESVDDVALGMDLLQEKLETNTFNPLFSN